MDKNDILRKIPKVDEVTQAVRKVLDSLRGDVVEDKIGEIPPFDEVVETVVQVLGSNKGILRKVINATGIVLHTNLGRAPMAAAAAEAAKQAALNYSTLEYDLATGRRGGRMEAVEGLLTELCGCEAAICVNNNAAAVLLVLSALCGGGQVVVSRGEMVEIGGSFRVPNIISQGGAKLVEVGTTNKTRFSDYANVICEETKSILKVHTSNYRIVGYTQEVGLAELARLATECAIPLIYDLGGGALIRMSEFEPTVQETLKQGVDILCFSGDKLLGGPQAGIILGKKSYIDIIRTHPLYRALRLDKMSLAALGATLQLYTSGNLEAIPTLEMLAVSEVELEAKAHRLLVAVPKINGGNVEVVKTYGQAGGGSLPTENLPSCAVAIALSGGTLQDLEAALRKYEIPIIARIYKDRLLLDVRTIKEVEFPIIAKALAAFAGG